MIKLHVAFDHHSDTWTATVALGEMLAMGDGVTRREAVAWALRELADQIDRPVDEPVASEEGQAVAEPAPYRRRES